MTIGLYAGSFDPLHLGHLSLIEMASRLCSQLYVVAAGNPDKVESALFDLSERRDLLDASTRHLGSVVSMQHGGLVADLAAELGVDMLIRGMGKEMTNEFQMAVANDQVAGIPTIFLPPNPATRWISSRMVRTEYLRGGTEAVSPMVPAPVADALAARTIAVR